MARSASPLNPKRWFDRMQPQTLQIATWLLYLNGFFALVDLIDGGGYLNVIRIRYTGGILIGLLSVALYAAGGWLMANDRKLGYQLAIVAAVSPFFLRLWAYQGIPASVYDKISDGSTLELLFDVALVALILHPHSRNHQKIWYK